MKNLLLLFILFPIFAFSQVTVHNLANDEASLVVENFLKVFNQNSEESKKYISPKIIESFNGSYFKVNSWDLYEFYILKSPMANKYYFYYKSSRSEKWFGHEIYTTLEDGQYYILPKNLEISSSGYLTVWVEPSFDVKTVREFKAYIKNLGGAEKSNVEEDMVSNTTTNNEKKSEELKSDDEEINSNITRNSNLATKIGGVHKPVDLVNRDETKAVYNFLINNSSSSHGREYILPITYDNLVDNAQRNKLSYVKKENYKPINYGLKTFAIVDYNETLKFATVLVHTKDDEYYEYQFLTDNENGRFYVKHGRATKPSEQELFDPRRYQQTQTKLTKAAYEERMSEATDNSANEYVQLVDGFAEMVVEILKDDKWTKITEVKGNSNMLNPLPEKKIIQQKKKTYLFLFLTHKDNVFQPLTHVIQPELDEKTIMMDFFEVHNWDHPLVPEDIKIYRAGYKADVSREFMLKFFSVRGTAYGYFMAFEKK